MPTVRARRRIAATAEQLWSLVGEPESLPRWWPSVARVEDASADAWTAVLASPRGKPLRADYSLLERVEARRLCWRHEVAASPFERLLSAAVYELELSEQADGATDVALIARLRLRGFARLGGVLVSHATRKQLDEALDGLETAVAR